MDLTLMQGEAKTNLIDKQIRFAFSKHEDPLAAFEAIGRDREISAEKHAISSTNFRKHHGIYYTPYSVARRLIDDLLTLDNEKLALDSTFLDPCSGHGIFIIAYIDTVAENLQLTDRHDFQLLVDNIYYADIDKVAIELLRGSVSSYIEQKYEVKVSLKESNAFIGNSLFSNLDDGFKKNDLRQIFGQKNGFDVVATNPPYKLLKDTKKHYDSSADYNTRTSDIVNFLKSGNYYPLNEGTLNLYKLFCEEILSNLSSKSGLIGLLIPQTLLNDQQSTKLRSAILDNKLSTVFVIPESNSFFDGITQSFCMFGITKGSSSEELAVVADVREYDDFQKAPTKVNKSSLRGVADSMPVISLEEAGWGVLSKIHQFPHLKDIPQIRNLRGELDVTLNKGAITNKQTDWALLRGTNLSLFSHRHGSDFVSKEFALHNPKKQYSQEPRLACQQIANINGRKRIKFSLVEPDDILANSCNFVAIDDSSLRQDGELSLKYLLGILNSSVIEWRFRLTSSNNHVGNHELGNLPIPLPTKSQRLAIEELVDLTLQDQNDFNLSKLNSGVAQLYGLNATEFDYIKSQNFDTINQEEL